MAPASLINETAPGYAAESMGCGDLMRTPDPGDGCRSAMAGVPYSTLSQQGNVLYRGRCRAEPVW